MIVGKISPDAWLGLYGDHIDWYINLSFFNINILFILQFLDPYRLMTSNKINAN